VQLDDSSFDAATASGVVLVDFWAPWCPPCRQQLPLVDKAAELLKGVAKVAKLNVDEGQKTAAKFNVASIPTLIVFKDGKEVKKFVGVTQPEVLVEAVKAAL
jgi:thioredoxin 1